MEDKNTTEVNTEEPLCTGSAFNDLLSCPFCGNIDLEKDYAEYDANIDYWIECPKCEVILSRSTKNQAETDWNKRIQSWNTVKTALPKSGTDIIAFGGTECGAEAEIGFCSEVDTVANMRKGEFVDFSFSVTHWLPIPTTI